MTPRCVVSIPEGQLGEGISEGLATVEVESYQCCNWLFWDDHQTVTDMEFNHPELLDNLYRPWVPARAEVEFIKSSEPRTF